MNFLKKFANEAKGLLNKASILGSTRNKFSLRTQKRFKQVKTDDKAIYDRDMVLIPHLEKNILLNRIKYYIQLDKNTHGVNTDIKDACEIVSL